MRPARGPAGARGCASSCRWPSRPSTRSCAIATKPPKKLKVLFADDEKSLQNLMSIELPRMGHEVTVCPDGATAIAAVTRGSFDCLLVDLDMPGANGIEVITKAKEAQPEIEAVVLTGKSSLDTAVAALRQGAFDYLTKPCRLVEIESLLKRVCDKRELTNKCRALKRQVERISGRSELIGGSRAMQQVRELIAKVAPTASTVLVRGETGTGKELVARAVHDQSPRAEAPYVAINCGALPEALIESELFGHRKGAFTGADEHRVGMFEVANGGTLFLDEIGELPKAMQAKLLRFLESGEIRRVGENQSFTVDVRVVCATNRDLEEMVEAEDFREDLLFRINTFEIRLPALRERVEDIPELATHLLRRFRPQASAGESFTPAALHLLTEHVWPGNVRELANVVEHAAILSSAGPIDEDDLPRNFDARRLRVPILRAVRPMSLREMELQAIQHALERHAGNKPKAAEELGISLKTLYNKLNQIGTGSLEQSA
ncbi:MAG: sigma-54 dependent transcriptional regulator [Pirellulales bacterium]|nr:sigma-54 dependent transcriptional regulator [Pirellulales bacterium]